MNIPVKITSKLTGRLVQGYLTPRQLLDLLDESELVQKLTMCDCQPVGETNVVDCNCDEEWEDCEVLIGDEVANSGENTPTNELNEHKAAREYWYSEEGERRKEINHLREALQKAERFISKIMGFYGQGLTVYNWHQNGEGEPWDNFFDENMDGDELEVIRNALNTSETLPEVFKDAVVTDASEYDSYNLECELEEAEHNKITTSIREFLLNHQGYKRWDKQENEIVERCGNLERYDDDALTPPKVVDELRGKEAEDFWEWMQDMTKASARNALGMLKESLEEGKLK